VGHASLRGRLCGVCRSPQPLVEPDGRASLWGRWQSPLRVKTLPHSQFLTFRCWSKPTLIVERHSTDLALQWSALCSWYDASKLCTAAVEPMKLGQATTGRQSQAEKPLVSNHCAPLMGMPTTSVWLKSRPSTIRAICSDSIRTFAQAATDENGLELRWCCDSGHVGLAVKGPLLASLRSSRDSHLGPLPP
jgi:hypothetical protein